jgi:hypothetical protein
MLTKIDFRLRSFFLRLDRRDYVSSRILALFYRFLNPIKFFRQLFLGVKKNKEIFLHENGYIQYQFESENLTKIISRSNKIINDYEFKKKLDNSKKEFLQSYKIDFFDKKNHMYLKLLFEKNFLNTVRSYLGKHITLKEVNIFYSPNKNFETGRSQELHMDGDSNKQLKLFLYLHDVDTKAGPLTIIPKKISKKIYKIMRQKKLITKKTNRINDKSLEDINYTQYLKPLHGKSGTINLVDTSNCYHFGSRPGSKERFIVLYQFLDSFSYYLPSSNNNKRSIQSSEILTTKEVKIINNLVQYSN